MNDSCQKLLRAEGDAFLELMHHEVEPYLDAHRRDTDMEVCGHRIRVRIFIADEPVGKIIIGHGFSEYGDKNNEMFYYFVQMGYNVFLPEFVGHGYSERLVDDPSKVYVRSFDEYVGDMRAVTDLPLYQDDLPAFLLGHSMGGAIAALLTERDPSLFRKVILSSPMIHPNLGKYPEFLVGLIAFFRVLTHHEKDYVIGKKPFSGIRNMEGSSCGEAGRYEYTFGKRCADVTFQTWSATYGWLHACLKATRTLRRNARRLTADTLVIYSGRDTMVDPPYTARFASALPRATVVCITEAKHESFHCALPCRTAFYETIFDFLKT